MVLKTCKGRVCTHPWETLHPGGHINSLKHALNPQFDRFYSQQPVMWFSDCPMAYIAESENQQPVKEYAEELTIQKAVFDWGRHWQHFT